MCNARTRATPQLRNTLMISTEVGSPLRRKAMNTPFLFSASPQRSSKKLLLTHAKSVRRRSCAKGHGAALVPSKVYGAASPLPVAPSRSKTNAKISVFLRRNLWLS